MMSAVDVLYCLGDIITITTVDLQIVNFWVKKNSPTVAMHIEMSF